MANENGWGDGASNNDIGWGKGADNEIGWGSVYSVSSAGLTDIIGTPAVDPDAQAFITAASITDPTQQSAINQLVVDLKGYNIWTKMKAIYPIVGGTAATHKWNLKDPRDLDAAFRLTFASGWTHSSTGMTPTNAYADTFLIPNTNLGLNTSGIGVYSRTNNLTNSGDVGVYDSGFNNGLYLLTNTADTKDYSRNNSNSGIVGTSYGSSGFLLNYRVSSTQFRIRINTNDNVYSINSSALSTNKIYLGAINGNGLAQYNSNRQIAFGIIADGLTTTDASNLRTAVQAFQTTLGRQV